MNFSPAQEKLSNMVDSLPVVKTDREFINLSLRIADYLKYNDWKRTERYIKNAKNKALYLKNKEDLATFYFDVAEIYFDVDAFDIALEYYLEAHDYFKNNNYDKRYEIENIIAIIHSQLNNKERAYYYFKKSYNYYKSKKDPYKMAKSLNNLGTLFLNNGAAEQALVYLIKSNKILEKQENGNLKTYVLTNLGRCHQLKNNGSKAKYFLDQALQSLEETRDVEIKNYVYNQNALFYLNSGDYEKSIHFCLKAKELGVPRYSFSNHLTYQILYKAYLKKQDYKQASLYFSEYDNIRDSLDIERKAVNVERHRIEQDFKNKEKINHLQAKQKRSNLVIVILLLLLLLLALIIFLLKYKTRFSKLNLENKLTKLQKRELELSLELRNKELTTKAIIEADRHDFFSSLKDEISEIQKSGDLHTVKSSLEKLSQKVSKNSSEGIWDDFELSFSNVHESFFEKLNNRHPNLTVFDKRVCALIKLNLSTKEIASLTKTSVKSIENLRTRLRKKLGLTNQKIEIYDYLSEF